jgi:ABC-type antimicrobial peptide transport system permease subunit
MEDRIVTGLVRPRLYAIVLGSFAGLAVFVSAVGLFGVLSYSVALRSKELAIRTALGAQASAIVGLVVRQAAVILVVGLAIGLGAATLLTPLVGAMLFGVSARDGASYLLVTGVLVAVMGLASVGPARRAARLDTLRELRR